MEMVEEEEEGRGRGQRKARTNRQGALDDCDQAMIDYGGANVDE